MFRLGKLGFRRSIPKAVGFPSTAAQVNGEHPSNEEQPAWPVRFGGGCAREPFSIARGDIDVTGCGQGGVLVLGAAGFKHNGVPSFVSSLVAVGDSSANPFSYESVWRTHSQKNCFVL